MQSKKLMRMFTLGLALASPVAFAGDATTQLTCPEGTKQAGSKSDGLFCRKQELAGGSFVAHGPYRSFHANGKKAAVGQYSDGFKTGRPASPGRRRRWPPPTFLSPFPSRTRDRKGWGRSSRWFT